MSETRTRPSQVTIVVILIWIAFARNRMLPEIDAALIGMNNGDSATAEHAFPAGLAAGAFLVRRSS